MKGKVSEIGSHHALLERKGLYYSIGRQQVGERRSYTAHLETENCDNIPLEAGESDTEIDTNFVSLFSFDTVFCASYFASGSPATGSNASLQGSIHTIYHEITR
ncbi:MAG TPA: hypothetical protein PLJ60_12955 [Chryseolinea sp.]|nr:hypothetical protein [Chryseolinea sp.]